MFTGKIKIIERVCFSLLMIVYREVSRLQYHCWLTNLVIDCGSYVVYYQHARSVQMWTLQQQEQCVLYLSLWPRQHVLLVFTHSIQNLLTRY